MRSQKRTMTILSDQIQIYIAKLFKHSYYCNNGNQFETNPSIYTLVDTTELFGETPPFSIHTTTQIFLKFTSIHLSIIIHSFVHSSIHSFITCIFTITSLHEFSLLHSLILKYSIHLFEPIPLTTGLSANRSIHNRTILFLFLFFSSFVPLVRSSFAITIFFHFAKDNCEQFFDRLTFP